MEYKPSYSDSLRADVQPSYSDSLYHHGILGMHWGIRRYQNSDGSLTPEGRIRYGRNYKKTYDIATKRTLFSKNTPEDTRLQSALMNNEAWDRITATPEFYRANQIGFSKEYIQNTTKQERKKETEIAIELNKQTSKRIFNESLNKHADILAKKIDLDINDVGVRDALRQALVDESGSKPTIEAILKHKPKQRIPKNYRFKGLPADWNK